MSGRGHVPWNKGTKGVARPNSGSFRRGDRPWNAGTRGVMRPNSGSFGRRCRGGKPNAPLGARYFDPQEGGCMVKVAGRSPHPAHRARPVEFGHWRPLRLVNWAAANGPLPPGCVIRRILPLCDCAANLVLIDQRVNARLNHGSWARPRRPWRTLPPDRDLRLAAIAAAVAYVLAREREAGR